MTNSKRTGPARRDFLLNIGKLGALTLALPKKTWMNTTVTDNPWHIEQFKDKGLAHFSYAILVGKKIILVDPARNPEPYYAFAKSHGAEIKGVIETHPHADFISAHTEIRRKTGASIYASSLLAPAYPFTPFDEGQILELEKGVRLRCLHTPGHAPDGISVILEANGKQQLVFSGDSLLIGDVGRPDLREYSGNVQSQREALAKQMYHTVWNKFAPMPDDVILYPAHGAGSLCGKSMRDANSSSIGEERAGNPAFKKMTEAEFVNLLLQDLPAVPAYFPYDVSLNVKGAGDLQQSLDAVPLLADNVKLPAGALLIDARPGNLFKNSANPGAFNLQDGTKFETWLGSVITPERPFYLAAENRSQLAAVVAKTAKIGYERQIKGAFVYDAEDGVKASQPDPAKILEHPEQYTIIDVRTTKEAKSAPLFATATVIPITDLEKRLGEIPREKPIVVHCASGFRSALGASIIKAQAGDLEVYDFGTDVLKYLKHP